MPRNSTPFNQRKLAISAAAIAAVAFTCQGTNAGSAKPVDPRITGVSWVVGGGCAVV
jgi:hypothetical protein